MKRIIVGCDHVAVALKLAVLEHLQKRGLETIDAGTSSPQITVDYPDYAQKVALAVTSGQADGGIVLCGTGLGVSIAANKICGARAALCHDVYTAHQSRAHNDANILAMGSYVVTPERMPGIVDEWLDTPFEYGRHTARLQMLDRYLSEIGESKQAFDPGQFQYAMALSARKTLFGPIVFAGRLEEGFTALAKAGFHCVEMSMRFADDVPLDTLQAMLDKNGLRVTALATGQGCIHDQLCLANPNLAIFREAVQRLIKIIDLATSLGANVIIGGVRGKLSGSEQEQNSQRLQVTDGFATCDRYAEERGVGLLLEPINRYETNLINNVSEALKFLDETGSRTAKVLLDTFHSNIEEVNIPAAVHLLGDRLGYVHVADSNRQAPGQGHLNFHEIFCALGELGYKGVVSGELLPLPDDESAVLRTANFFAGLGAPMQVREPQP